MVSISIPFVARIVAGFAVALSAAGCADASTSRTALDPSAHDDAIVRELSSEIIDSVEKCDFGRIDAIIGTDTTVVLDHVSADDPSGLEGAYYGITHCEMRLDYENVKIGHAVYDSLRDHPGAVSVSVGGRIRVAGDDSWDDFVGAYFFDKDDGNSWRLVSSWLPEE